MEARGAGSEIWRDRQRQVDPRHGFTLAPALVYCVSYLRYQCLLSLSILRKTGRPSESGKLSGCGVTRYHCPFHSLLSEPLTSNTCVFPSQHSSSYTLHVNVSCTPFIHDLDPLSAL